MGIQYPEVLLDAAASLAQELERRGMPAEAASDAAFAAVESLRARWGGADIYIPMAKVIELAPKHQQIYERWRAGEQIPALAGDFGYSYQWIRQVIRTARLARSQKVHAPQLLVEECG
jgi:Mor family transcriptional regulator